MKDNLVADVLSRNPASENNMDTVNSKSSSTDIGTVSYTHLDVYKRQVYPISGYQTTKSAGIGREGKTDQIKGIRFAKQP